MKIALMLACVALFLSGCSVMKIVPEPVAQGTVNEKESSQTISRNRVVMTVQSGDLEITSYNLEGSVTSFLVAIENQTDGELHCDYDSFLLVDNEGRQYFPLTPDKVKEIVARNTYYLIPYPYVGFYYLEDYERSTAENRMTSDQPYYYDLYPQDIYTKSLPTGTIIPNAKVVGLVYFRIDMEGKKGVSLRFYKKGTPKSGPADFEFPFKIVK